MHFIVKSLILLIFTSSLLPCTSSALTNVSTCGQTLDTADEIYQLNQSVNSSGTCFTIAENNITIDCNYFTINYSQLEVGYAINSINYDNIQIRNCNITEGSEFLEQAGSYAIYFSNSNNGTIENNNITTLETSARGIYLEGSHENKLEGNNITTYGTGDGIRLSESSNSELSGNNIIISGIYGYGIYLLSDSDNNTLLNNSINVSSYMGYGIYIQSSSNETLKNNVINATHAMSIYIEGGTSPLYYNHVIDESNFAHSKPIKYYFNQSDLVIKDSSAWGQLIITASENVSVRNMSFTVNGIELADTTNSTICDNNISVKGYAILLQSSQGNVVDNNMIKTSCIYGHGIYLNPNSSNNTLKNNNITSDGFVSDGIYLRSISNNNTIINNTINTSNAVSIHISSSSNNVIINNTAKSSTAFEGSIELAWYTNNTYVENNYISNIGDKGYGIHIDFNSVNNTIINNIINTTMEDGHGIFMVQSSNNHLDKNNISTYGREAYVVFLYESHGNNISQNAILSFDEFGYGIYLRSNSSNNTITENNIDTADNYGSGVYINSSSRNNTISGNTITTGGTFANGFEITSNSSDNDIVNNEIFTSGISSDGILMTSSHYNRIRGNNITTTRQNAYGINIKSGSSNNSLSYNNINNTGQDGYGVYIYEGPDNEILNNTINISGYEGCGITIREGSNNTKILNNNIYSSGYLGYGIHLYESSRCELNSNKVITTNASGSGLYIYYHSDNNAIFNNSISTYGSSGYGIRITRSSNNELRNNSIYTKEMHGRGIYLYLDSENNSIINIRVNTSYPYGYGIYIRSCTNNTFRDSHIFTKNYYSYALYLYENSNITVIDSVLNASYPGTADIRFRENGTINTINTTFNRSEVEWESTAIDAILNVSWYLDVNVQNSTGDGIENITVDIDNSLDDSVFYGNTSSSGYITTQKILEFTATGPYSYSGSCTTKQNLTCYTPHNIIASRTGYLINSTSEVINSSKKINLTLEPLKCGQTLNIANVVYTLTQDLNSSNNCFTIGAHNVTLDCNGYIINYSQSEVGYAINSTNYDSTVLKNCDIVQGNSSVIDAYAMYLHSGSDNTIINCVFNSTNYDFYLENDSYATLLNTTFNKSGAWVNDTSTLQVKWYLDVKVVSDSSPLEGASVKVESHVSSLESFTGSTDAQGYFYTNATEYVQNSTDNISYTPYTVTVSKSGYVSNYKYININESKNVAVTLTPTTEEPPEDGNGNGYSFPPTTETPPSEEENATPVILVNVTEETVVVTTTIPTIINNTAKKIDIREANISVVSIEITTISDVANVKLIVERMKIKPARASAPTRVKVYAYLRVDKENITDNDISKVMINFKVKKQWLSENNVSNYTHVALFRYENGKWKKLPTKKTSGDTENIYFEAASPGLSFFAVGITTELAEPEKLCVPNTKRCLGNELQECNVLGTVWIAKEVCVNGCDSAALACNPPPTGDIPWYYIVIPVLVVAAVVVVYLMNKKSKKPKTLEEALEGVQPV